MFISKRILAGLPAAALLVFGVGYAAAPHSIDKTQLASVTGGNGCDCETQTSACPGDSGCGSHTTLYSPWLQWGGNGLSSELQSGCGTVQDICPEADDGSCPKACGT
jgi:hypothetical protein